MCSACTVSRVARTNTATTIAASSISAALTLKAVV
jgi:hypothetical protein